MFNLFQNPGINNEENTSPIQEGIVDLHDEDREIPPVEEGNTDSEGEPNLSSEDTETNVEGSLKGENPNTDQPESNKGNSGRIDIEHGNPLNEPGNQPQI